MTLNEEVVMSNTSVKVSVIIPTFNRRAQLEETLESVRAQTYELWEAVVVDDGSEDDTADYMEQVCHQEPRIRFSPRKGDGGNANVCRNQGFQETTGAYVIFLDSDDVLAPHCLAQRVAALDRNLDVDIAVFPAQMFSESIADPSGDFGTWNGAGDLDRLLKMEWPIQTTGPVWRRESLERVGGWDERLPSWQDWELFVRAIAKKETVLRFPTWDYYFRSAADSHKTSVVQFKSLAHLRAAVTMLDGVEMTLAESGLLNRERREYLAGIYLLLARSMTQTDGGLSAAFAAWSEVKARSLHGRKARLLGSVLILGTRFGLHRIWPFLSLEARLRWYERL